MHEQQEDKGGGPLDAIKVECRDECTPPRWVVRDALAATRVARAAPPRPLRLKRNTVLFGVAATSAAYMSPVLSSMPSKCGPDTVVGTVSVCTRAHHQPLLQATL